MKNLVTITGRLTKDAEIKYFESGKCKATFSLAVDGYANKEKITTFVSCELWNKQGEFAAEYFKKGKTVTAIGELVTNEYKEKVYYNLKCYNAGFTGLQMVVAGEITYFGNKKLNINTKNGVIEVNYYGEQPPEAKIFVLGVVIQNNVPTYNYLGAIE